MSHGIFWVIVFFSTIAVAIGGLVCSFITSTLETIAYVKKLAKRMQASDEKSKILWNEHYYLKCRVGKLEAKQCPKKRTK